MRIAHVVVTDAFAGTERYVAGVARRLSDVGHEVTVLGGSGTAMPAALGSRVSWRNAGTPSAAVRALVKGPRFDIVHAHLTYAESAALATRWRHRGAVVATRHIAIRRGNSALGRFVAPLIAWRLARELPISGCVAAAAGLPADSVLYTGVPQVDAQWRADAREVVMAQRLEPEKDTLVGLKAWDESGLGDAGWRLSIAGTGSLRPELERFVHDHQVPGVNFLGPIDDMVPLWSRAGMLLAPTASEGLGLSVLEAMAAGVPVVAAMGGGHLETVGLLPGNAGFAPGNPSDAAVQLRRLAASPPVRERLGSLGQELQRQSFDLDRHVVRLCDVYGSVAPLIG